MRKNGRKLALNRETLRSLETWGLVIGGASAACGTTFGTRCGTTDDGNTYGNCQNTFEVCSANYCETGGTACSGLSCPG